MEEKKVPFEYETKVIEYKIPESKHKYTPDFIIGTVIVEAKGKFDAETRRKMALVIEQNPDLDIRMLFMRDQPIQKKSKTLYSTWCDKHYIQYAVGDEIPPEWIKDGLPKGKRGKK